MLQCCDLTLMKTWKVTIPRHHHPDECHGVVTLEMIAALVVVVVVADVEMTFGGLAVFVRELLPKREVLTHLRHVRLVVVVKLGVVQPQGSVNQRTST